MAATHVMDTSAVAVAAVVLRFIMKCWRLSKTTSWHQGVYAATLHQPMGHRERFIWKIKPAQLTIGYTSQGPVHQVAMPLLHWSQWVLRGWLLTMHPLNAMVLN